MGFAAAAPIISAGLGLAGSLFGGGHKDQQQGQSFANFKSPWGSVNSSGNSVNFQPTMNKWQTKTLNQGNHKLFDFTHNLPTSFTPEGMFDNPFYHNTLSMLQAPIMRNYSRDQSMLNNNLNAQNQLGSSYDALMRRNLSQDNDYNMNLAEQQARERSFQVYNQGFQNQLAGMLGLRNDQTNFFNNIYKPMDYMAQLSGVNAQANAANMQNRQSQNQQFMNLLGTLGQGLQSYGGGSGKPHNYTPKSGTEIA